MINKCCENDIEKILDYIGKDYGKCLYIYIDLRKYGLTNENFTVWLQCDSEDKVTAIISEYYKGIQVYSKEGNLNGQEIAEFVLKKDPPIVLGMKETINKIRDYMPAYKEEFGTVGEIKALKCPVNAKAYSANIEELKEIVKVLAEDEGIGKPYGFESLYKQFEERKKEKFGRNYILRDDITEEIICHAGTYAELPELAVIGGVITAPKYRGKGFSKGVLAALCEELLKEGKDVFSFFYIPSAIKMHMGVGFEKIGDWAKLIK